jgi:transposase
LCSRAWRCTSQRSGGEPRRHVESIGNPGDAGPFPERSQRDRDLVQVVVSAGRLALAVGVAKTLGVSPATVLKVIHAQRAQSVAIFRATRDGASSKLEGAPRPYCSRGAVAESPSGASRGGSASMHRVDEVCLWTVPWFDMYRHAPFTDHERELADAVRDAADALAQARSERDAYITTQARRGANIADLARKFDLSREATYKILRRRPREERPKPAPDAFARLNALERRQRPRWMTSR